MISRHQAMRLPEFRALLESTNSGAPPIINWYKLSCTIDEECHELLLANYDEAKAVARELLIAGTVRNIRLEGLIGGEDLTGTIQDDLETEAEL